jgi:putative exosortase-associated protein (TIGR04073 family)
MSAIRTLCVCLLICGTVAVGFPRGPFYSESIPARSSRKFTRGVLNTVFFWTEVPKEINRDWRNTDPLTGVFTGTGKGIFKGAQRFGAGVYEMVTFPLDTPANYQPVMYPETPMEDGYDWGAEEYYTKQRTSKLDH